MLQKLLFIFLNIASVAAFVSNVQSIQSGQPNIVQLASNNPDLSTLVTALKQANLTATLSGVGDPDKQTDGPFTVFAPSNKAFSLLPAATLAHLLDPANINELLSVLEYHVLTSVALAKDLEARSFERTLQGSYMRFSTVPGTEKKYLRINGGAAIVEVANLEASNGVVHVIDNVLIPPGNSNINQILSTKTELSTFLLALELVGLTSALDGNGPLTRFGDRPGFTVFAPSNEAFANLPTGTLDHLLDIKNRGYLQSILEYHIIGGIALSAGCSNGDVRPGTFGGVCGNFDLDTSSFEDTLEGSAVNIRPQVVEGAGTVQLTPDDLFAPNATFSTIIEQDLGASNGVLHVIDRLLIPPVPTRTIAAAVTASKAHATFLAALKAADLTRFLDKPGLGSYTVFVPSEEAFAKLPSGTLNHLLDPKNVKELQTILEYHIIPGKVLRSGCTLIGRTCGPADLEGDAMKLGFQPATAFWDTLVPGQSVLVIEFEDFPFVGDSTNIPGRIEFFRNSLGDGTGGGNHAASNGIWHVIDKVLVPAPTQLTSLPPH